MEINAFIDGRSKRITSKKEVIDIICGIQETIFNFRETKGEVEINFCQDGTGKSRYTIYINDVSKDQRKLLKYAAFIVPFGR